jgi:mono/diheme cytochrome c family protein
MPSSCRSVCTNSLVLAIAWAWSGFVAAEDHPGVAIYREHCLRCHGEHGDGTPHVPDPLIGDRSVNQLAAHIDDTMPEDDPSRVTGEDAHQVAAYIHAAFYSAVARDRHRPPRIELSRLTVRQHRNVLADLIGAFRTEAPAIDTARGLEGEYFKTRGFKRDTGLVLERVDPLIDFDFGTASPAPGAIEPNRFSIRWTGAVMPTETGVHEFVIRTEQAAKLTLNANPGGPALIDAAVKSGSDTEYRASIFLLGGRAYPLTLEFWKARQGVDNDDTDDEKSAPASIRMLWRPPHGALETVPNRVLIPHKAPRVFAPATPFPPDDRSIGYERGTSVSEAWLSSTTAAAIETADHVLADIDHLARGPRDAADREASLRVFAAAFAERALRRPLTADQRSLVIDRPFADAPDLDTGLRRSLLAVLGSPRFLFREAGTDDAFATAARLSFGLWDSIPDDPLWQAAARGELANAEQIRGQAERMVQDRRTRAKVRDFLFSWLRVDLGPELAKDSSRHPEFTPEVAADLRTSLELFLDDSIWVGGDFRRLFTADELPLNGRLAPIYGATLPVDAGFTDVRLDDGRRGGLLSHPYLMSVLSYPASTSPIHRGVFLARSVLGNTLRPPQEAIAPLPAEQHPDLTTRERVSLQTSAVTCQTCHTLINPLGFALEEFDEIGRYRSAERSADGARPIDASGSYQPRMGPPATFRGGRELGAYVAESHDAQEAFVQALFHALVKQPVRAWGVDTLDRLTTSFAASGFDIRRLLVDIMEVAAVPPRLDVASTPAPEPIP